MLIAQNATGGQMAMIKINAQQEVSIKEEIKAGALLESLYLDYIYKSLLDRVRINEY